MNENFLDHLFNALGHLGRAQPKADKSKGSGTSKKTKGPRIKRAAFDGAPRVDAPAPAKECCTAKR